MPAKEVGKTKTLQDLLAEVRRIYGEGGHMLPYHKLPGLMYEAFVKSDLAGALEQAMLDEIARSRGILNAKFYQRACVGELSTNSTSMKRYGEVILAGLAVLLDREISRDELFGQSCGNELELYRQQQIPRVVVQALAKEDNPTLGLLLVLLDAARKLEAIGLTLTEEQCKTLIGNYAQGKERDK